jgi:hypothetical protein
MPMTTEGTRTATQRVDRRSGRWTRRAAPVAALAVALGVLALGSVPGVSGVQATGRKTPPLANPTKTAKPLVHRFFVLVQNKDRIGLQRFLSSGFQVERADGSGAGKRQYLTNLPTVNKFEITNLRATQARTAIIVRYLANVEGVVNGKPYTPGPAPRLSVFVWNGKRWLLAAHANFNPLSG